MRTAVISDYVLGLMGKLKTDKTLGPDGIHLRVLKEFKCEIVDLLRKICNMCLLSIPIPEEWKVASLT